MADGAARSVVERLQSLADPDARESQARYGIATDSALGIRIPRLRALARELGRNHDLALGLWDTGIHEARILASMVDDPGLVSETQMEAWASAFNSWDLVDQCCGNLFVLTSFAWSKALEWSARDEEFVKRAAFALMAYLALRDKKAQDEPFEPFFSAIEREADDERNFVKKAVSWALRQIGKRNARLRARALQVAEGLKEADARSARWIGSEASRELTKNA